MDPEQAAKQIQAFTVNVAELTRLRMEKMARPVGTRPDPTLMGRVKPNP